MTAVIVALLIVPAVLSAMLLHTRRQLRQAQACADEHEQTIKILLDTIANACDENEQLRKRPPVQLVAMRPAPRTIYPN